jgi:hypothetical protein
MTISVMARSIITSFHNCPLRELQPEDKCKPQDKHNRAQLEDEPEDTETASYKT